MANPVNWFHITSKEHAELVKFYGEAFDWKLSPGPGGMTFAETGKGGISGGIAAPPEGGSDANSIHIYVSTDNLDEQLERIEKAGGRPAGFRQPLPPGMGTISGFFDPVGNFVGLWEQEPKPKKPAAKRAKKTAAKKTAAKKTAAKKTAKKAAKKSAKKSAKRR